MLLSIQICKLSICFIFQTSEVLDKTTILTSVLCDCEMPLSYLPEITWIKSASKKVWREYLRLGRKKWQIFKILFKKCHDVCRSFIMYSLEI